MKVLLVNTLYPPQDIGGAERSVAQLARGLVEAGADVSVLALHEGEAVIEGMVDGIRVRRLPLRNLYWPFDGAKPAAVRRAIWHGVEAVGGLLDGAVAEAVERERPDVIHAHLMTGFSHSVYRVARRKGLPLVQTLRDYSMLCARASMFRPSDRCERRCGSCVLLTRGKRSASAAVDHVVAISTPLLKAHLGHGYFLGIPSSVIGNAAGAARVEPRPSLADDPTMTFGLLGRIEPAKGVEILLSATTRLKGNWRLRIGGRGDAAYVDRLKRAFPDPRIAWLGQVEASGFYRDVDVVVAPAIWAEPFGRVVVEAAAHGRAVIASRIGGLPEATADARQSVLVEPGDVAALAQAMQRTIQAPAEWRFGAMTPHTPAWSEASIASAYMDIYRDVLAARASRISAERAQR